MSAIERPPQIDFHTRKTDAPLYQLQKIELNNQPTGSVAVNPGSSTMMEFKLPTQVYNLARSYLCYTLSVGSTAGQSVVTFEDLFEISSTTFGTAAGLDLVNLPFASNYTQVARKIESSLEDVMGHDGTSSLYKCNTPATPPFILTPGAASAALAVAVPTDPNTGNLIPGGRNRVTALSYSGTENYLETRYMDTGSSGAAATRYRQYPLSGFVNTLLGVDRDFFGGQQELYLRFTVGTADKMVYTITGNQIDPSAGAASVTAGLATISNVCLYLAMEKNTTIIESMMGAYSAGKLKFNIPYILSSKRTGGAAGSITSINLQLTPAYGKRLKRIIHTVYNPNERLNTSFDHANMNGEKIDSYQTALDSQYIQNRILSCKANSAGRIYSDDYLENKKFIDGRSCILSQDMYKTNWFHCDQFFEVREKNSLIKEVNMDEGVIMDRERNWTFTGNVNSDASAANLNHYTFAEFAREVLVSPSGVTFLPNMTS
jgi:hypothetical protein